MNNLLYINDTLTGVIMGVILTLMILGLWYIIVVEPDLKRAWKREDNLAKELQELKNKYKSQQ